MLDVALILIVLVVVAALAFDFINGFHDTANAIATVVATRVMPPAAAIMMAAVLNFAGALISTEVAGTISAGLVRLPEDATTAEAIRAAQAVILSAIGGAIFWQLLTWKYGIPSSSSHSLIGGLVGAVLLARFLHGPEQYGVIWDGLLFKVLIPLFASPMAGFLLAWLLMSTVAGIFGKFRPSSLNKFFARLQLLTAAGMAFSHGTNDAQKSMGIITLALAAFAFAAASPPVPTEGPPKAAAAVADVPVAKETPKAEAGSPTKKKVKVELWVVLACATAMGLGTAMGGHRIIKTMGHRIIRLEPVHGSMAETSAATIIQVASHLGMPISTTHVISGSIFGVGAAKRLSAVRWGVAKNMVTAWMLTLPLSGAVAALSYWLLWLARVG